jgi:uroporphyrinogen-III synthase
MQTTLKTILSTRPVPPSLVTAARLKNIELEAISFIDTEAVENVEVQQEIEQAALQRATVVFTSMNAVIVVTHLLDKQVPEWQVYCIGHKTKELAATYFGETAITGTADHANELADRIVEDDVDEVFFFCGNKRRDVLPKKLKEHDILVNEVIVYQTKTLARKLEKKYDAVLFFSPSAVESFFSLNQLANHTIVYAIGKTTSDAVKKHCNNTVVMGNSPDKEALIQIAIA